MPAINKIVVVTPNEPGNELTVRGGNDMYHDQIGKIYRGEVYRATWYHEASKYYLLEVYQKPFPFTVPAGVSAWADSKYLIEQGTTPPVDPPTPPVGTGLPLWAQVIQTACQAVVDLLKSK